MRKFSEITGEDALDVLAEILDPVSEICVDEDFIDNLRRHNKLQAGYVLLKHHKTAVLKILAILENEDPATYKPSIVELPVLIMHLINDPDLVPVFHLAGLETSSGSATENTQETEEG